MNTLTDKVLVGEGFGKGITLSGLGKNVAAIMCGEERIQESILYSRVANNGKEPEAVQADIRVNDVDDGV